MKIYYRPNAPIIDQTGQFGGKIKKNAKKQKKLRFELENYHCKKTSILKIVLST